MSVITAITLLTSLAIAWIFSPLILLLPALTAHAILWIAERRHTLKSVTTR